MRAITALKERPRGGANPASWNYEQFAQAHWDYQQPNHDRPPFFLWHREYVYQYEQALRSIDPSVSLPYWDWTVASQNPGAAELFLPRYFGGNGDPATNCVTTGVAAGWEGYANNNGCLRRCTDWSALYSPEGVNGLISSATTFAQLQRAIEPGPHGAVHLQMGGRCGDFGTMASANDPIFFVHHAMVDKIWWKWQQACPEFLNNYSGSLNERLAPFPVSARDVMDTQSERYCYTYSTSRGDTPAVRGRCANASSTGSATSSATASPTPTGDPYWIQHTIQRLVAGSEQFHANITVLAQRASQQVFAKREILLESYPEGYMPTHTPAATATATATSTDSGAYPTATITPYPDYSFNLNYTVHAPAPTDRSEKYLIRYPGKLPDDLLKRMMLDPIVVENIRGYAKSIVDQYNNKDGYISPAALINSQKEKCRRKY
jgi:hypothetical protein